MLRWPLVVLSKREAAHAGHDKTREGDLRRLLASDPVSPDGFS
jgi:hypothetical protein